LLLLLLLLLLSSMCPIILSMYSCLLLLSASLLSTLDECFFVCTCTYLLSDLQIQFLFERVLCVFLLPGLMMHACYHMCFVLIIRARVPFLCVLPLCCCC
jgi:hypothetical protein